MYAEICAVDCIWQSAVYIMLLLASSIKMI